MKQMRKQQKIQKGARMNKIEIKNHFISSGHEIKAFFIDDRPLYEYINEWIAENSELLQSIAPSDNLAICWTNEYDFKGDAEFVRFILNQNNAITPILSCPEDFDFSCIVIVADVIKDDHKVVWKRIGKVDHSSESFEQEKRSGILLVESYSEEDCIRYGNNIALAKFESPEWYEWISEHWDEELYRRRINYTFPYYQNENNIEWFATCNFEFDKQDYLALVENCYKK